MVLLFKRPKSSNGKMHFIKVSESFFRLNMDRISKSKYFESIIYQFAVSKARYIQADFQTAINFQSTLVNPNPNDNLFIKYCKNVPTNPKAQQIDINQVLNIFCSALCIKRFSTEIKGCDEQKKSFELDPVRYSQESNYIFGYASRCKRCASLCFARLPFAVLFVFGIVFKLIFHHSTIKTIDGITFIPKAGL